MVVRAMRTHREPFRSASHQQYIFAIDHSQQLSPSGMLASGMPFFKSGFSTSLISRPTSLARNSSCISSDPYLPRFRSKKSAIM